MFDSYLSFGMHIVYVCDSISQTKKQDIKVTYEICSLWATPKSNDPDLVH